MITYTARDRDRALTSKSVWLVRHRACDLIGASTSSGDLDTSRESTILRIDRDGYKRVLGFVGLDVDMSTKTKARATVSGAIIARAVIPRAAIRRRELGQGKSR